MSSESNFLANALSMAGLNSNDNTHANHNIHEMSSILCPATTTKTHSPSHSLTTTLDTASDSTEMEEEDVELLRSVTTWLGNFDSLTLTERSDFIPILEARGGSDKDPVSGLRRDSIPIGLGVIQHGGQSAVFQYQEDTTNPSNVTEDEEAAELAENVVKTRQRCNQLLIQHLQRTASGIIVRNNPGTLSPACQARLDAQLTELSEQGIVVLSTPKLIRAMGAKDALVKIKHLQVGLEDTFVYLTPEELMEGFRKTIAFQPRVLKQNRGSQGEGIWICKLQDESKYCANYGDAIADLDTPLVLMEAFDNHEEVHTVAEFLEFCSNGRTEKSGEWQSTGIGKYLEGGIESGAMLVDQRFLPRIVEGEVRCTMVGPELIGLVHKKPREGGLSATLQSGAIYTNYAPDAPEFKVLVDKFRSDIPHILECFDIQDQPLPLLWTADFIFGEPDEDGKDCFYVGEFNCSCVGVTQQLEFADLVGKTAHIYCTEGFGGEATTAL
jgi:glutathione synthase/RimK-type ligase-like ATP-grasp enzyme